MILLAYLCLMSGGMAMYSDRVSNINKIHHFTDESGETVQ